MPLLEHCGLVITRWWAMWRNRRAYKKVGSAYLWLCVQHISRDGNESVGLDLLICALLLLDKEYNEL